MADVELDFSIRRLGECRIASPLTRVRFTRDEERVLYPSRLDEIGACVARCEAPPSMEAAGPRERIFFDPSKIAAGIVTCGGLCPGLNDVIRATRTCPSRWRWCAGGRSTPRATCGAASSPPPGSRGTCAEVGHDPGGGRPAPSGPRRQRAGATAPGGSRARGIG